MKKKLLVSLSLVFVALFGVTQTASAMHIMEGYLPLGYAVAWGAVCIPFLIWGAMKIKKLTVKNRKTLLIFAMMGAYAFVLSSLKLPSVTGSSSHPTGTGLGAVLFGPAPMAIIGVIVLLFQSILLAHGGLTTLGANTFSMAIVGPFVTYGVYKLCKKLKVNKLVSVGIACAMGCLMTYVITSVQLAIAHPAEIGGVGESLVMFMGIFAVTQLPLAVVEGILSAVVIVGLESYAKSELTDLGFYEEQVAL